jgi:hypothetical protein
MQDRLCIPFASMYLISNLKINLGNDENVIWSSEKRQKITEEGLVAKSIVEEAELKTPPTQAAQVNARQQLKRETPINL